MSNLDKLTKKHTAFPSFVAMLTAEGGYRPTLYTNAAKTQQDREELTHLANSYDRNQAIAGDSRRAYRV